MKSLLLLLPFSFPATTPLLDQTFGNQEHPYKGSAAEAGLL